MANVMFKRGLSTALPSTGVDGVFYLTTDTNRLYVGNESGKLVELNQSINTVEKLGDLPTDTSKAQKGQYYYISGTNTLAYFDGAQWKQINPDTTLVANAENTVITEVTGGVKTTATVEDTTGKTSVGHVTYVGEDAVEIKKGSNANEIIVEAHDTKYELTSAEATVSGKSAASVVLSSDVDGEADEVVNVYGGANITVENTSDGIKISAADAANMYNTGVSEGFDANGKHTTSVTDGDGTKTSAGVTPTITYGNNKSAVFANGTAVLDVYDKGQVDSLISMADAMHYMGTVSDADAATKLDITKAQNGDTYKAATNITFGGQTAKIGDLIIAKGEEGANGKLDSNGTWEVIPSGDSQVISAIATAALNKLVIEDNAADASGTIASIQVTDDDGNIEVTSTASGTDLVINVAHAGPTAAATTLTGSANDVALTEEGSAEFTAVTSLSYDANGHVVSAGTKKLTVIDTHNHLQSVTYTTTGGADTIGTAVTVTNTVVTDDETKQGTFSVASETLRLKQNAGAVSVDLIWGSF